jgi:hypothetical protein
MPSGPIIPLLLDECITTLELPQRRARHAPTDYQLFPLEMSLMERMGAGYRGRIVAP